MVRYSFNCYDKGELITFDVINSNKLEALRLANEWARASGYSQVALTLACPYSPPVISNVTRHKWNNSGKWVSVSVGCARS